MLTALLILDDATLYPGRWWGAQPPSIEELDPVLIRDKGAGEVVFNTAMSGYHEVLTDPSYTGQLVVMTYPHIGNYGTDASWSETGPESDTHRSAVKAAGFVVHSLYDGELPDGRGSLSEFMRVNATPAIADVDTRALTLHLRDAGSRRGIIVRVDEDLRPWGPRAGTMLPQPLLERVVTYLRSFPDMKGRNLVGAVGSSVPVVVNADGKPHIALLDCGVKANIVRELTALGCKLTVFPSTAGEVEIRTVAPDALLVSNGPGDPAVLERQIATVRGCIGRLPVLGICLGHQLIAEALGARTYKMKFGHHGANHPVRDEQSGRVFVTSQNHGFSVEEASLPEGTRVWFRNANDHTIEGIRCDHPALASAQFHPESAPGPRDSRWVFGAFLDLIQTHKRAGGADAGQTGPE
ncbi:MAG: carbamoyl-phosphate synthase small subunit [Spirochaetaceae bacterium]|nr:MAG: carbamoyl-phosphate synthase small subunit [Spirochaetaceae bacterium]